jgi:hypothetical protein
MTDDQKDAERWRKVIKLSHSGPAFRAVVISPPVDTLEEVREHLDEWIDNIKEEE